MSSTNGSMPASRTSACSFPLPAQTRLHHEQTLSVPTLRCARKCQLMWQCEMTPQGLVWDTQVSGTAPTAWHGWC